MANRFRNKSCVLCPNDSEGVGEHVWPAWFIGDFEGEGPFSIDKGGSPYTKRDGVTPVEFQALQGVHVPMCSQCNSRLNDTIETPAKPAVRRLIPRTSSHSWPLLTEQEVSVLASWFLKVGVLKAHPEAEHDSPQVNRDDDFPRLVQIEPEWLGWMRAGVVPPTGFSVYVMRRSLRDEAQWVGEKRRIVLPGVTVGTTRHNYQSWSFGIRGVQVSIVWHPRWPILHPLVAEGRAASLWPNPAPVDFASLPEVHSAEFGFHQDSCQQQFVDEDHLARTAQTPLQVDQDPVALFMNSAGY